MAESDVIRLATTTSTDNSGLLDYLLPKFTEDTGYRVEVIAVGTGRALKYGEMGDVDAVLVHARAAELKFVDAGYGVDRVDVMYNRFLIVGPPDDPAGIREVHGAANALHRIIDSGASFVSRGDDSGTHKRELLLWGHDAPTHRRNYLEAGQGMAEVLTIASELGAYTLTDEGTFTALKRHLFLVPLLEGDPALFNPYSYIRVNPRRYPGLNVTGAAVLGDWLTSPRGQADIASFRIAGKELFVPDAAEGN